MHIFQTVTGKKKLKSASSSRLFCNLRLPSAKHCLGKGDTINENIPSEKVSSNLNEMSALIFGENKKKYFKRSTAI